MLTDGELEQYLQSLSEDQARAIRALRALVIASDPGLVEAVDTGKWFGGLLTYTTSAGSFLFALGPRGGATTFHMMPYYASKALQERHGSALKKFLTGKSCIRFQRFEELPEDAIRDILGNAGPAVDAMMEQRRQRK